jgi:hypothetical protein
MARILGAIEEGFISSPPRDELEALGTIRWALEQVNKVSARGFELPVTTRTPEGGLTFMVAGGAIVTIAANGSILVQRGADMLLRMIAR